MRRMALVTMNLNRKTDSEESVIRDIINFLVYQLFPAAFPLAASFSCIDKDK